MMRAALAAATLALLALVAATPAAAQEVKTYHVVKCHPWHPPADELSSTGGHPSYVQVNACSKHAPDPKFGINNDGAAGNNAYSQFMYIAPPNTTLDRACLQHRLRRQSHHRAEIVAFPGHRILQTGGDEPAGWSPTECYDLNHSQLIVRLACNQAGGCPEGANAHAYVRNLDLTIADAHPPVFQRIGGDLWTRSGWVAGPVSVSADTADAGAGSFHTVLYVNGAEVGRATGGCDTTLNWPYARRLLPCDGTSPDLDTSLDTRRGPFRDGSNSVLLYTADYAGNPLWEARAVDVDNASPRVSFANAQDPDDPELIRAAVADDHSGVDAAQLFYRPVGSDSWLPLQTHLEKGEARTRVDSSAVAPGDYEFRAEARDIAGNTATSLLRQNGSAMRLSFPLRGATKIEAGLGSGRASEQRLAYGEGSSVAGRLLDASGNPVANRSVTIVEFFGQGALIRERPTELLTDESGRFKTRLPAGPSREVRVEFDGTSKYLPRVEEVGPIEVRSRASFRTSAASIDEGERVRFSGRVRHRGARIPPGGKLAELQVRVSRGRWDTVGEAFRTRSNGRFAVGYRFGRHYTADALFRFRVKVQEEGGWPYERATTKQRRIIVRAG